MAILKKFRNFGVDNLKFIDDYLNILKGNSKNSVRKLGILDCFKFYSDNDPNTRHM